MHITGCLDDDRNVWGRLVEIGLSEDYKGEFYEEIDNIISAYDHGYHLFAHRDDDYSKAKPIKSVLLEVGESGLYNPDDFM
jgi:hypothetical protein